MSGIRRPDPDSGFPADLIVTVGQSAIAAGCEAGPAFLNPEGFTSALCDADGVVLIADDARAGARLDRLPSRRAARVSLLSSPDGRTAVAAVVAAPGAADWPLSNAVRARLASERAGYATLLCRPLSAIDPARAEAARAFGLTRTEARVAAGLVHRGDLRSAAACAGIPYETARKAAKSAMRKAGVRRQGELVGLWVSLQTGEAVTEPALTAALTDLFKVSARQARIAAAVADGGSRRDAADALGVSDHVVKTELKAVFAALQVPTVAALSVLINEVRILTRIVQATSMEQGLPAEPLRLIPRIGRPGRIAVVDHGPRGGLPVLILHTATTSRHNPASFIRAMQALGIRPIALDRPGFGLTTMVAGDYLEQSAQDLADILDTLGLKRACFLARGGGMVLSRFAAGWGERIERAVVINPEPPSALDQRRVGLTGAVKALVYGKPWLTGALAAYLRRNASAGIVERLVMRSLESSEADRAVLSDPEIRAAYVLASQRAALQGGAGFRAVATTEPFETARAIADGSMITIVCGSQDPLYSASDSLPSWQAAWPGCGVVIVPDGGRLVHFQKPALIAGLLRK